MRIPAHVEKGNAKGSLASVLSIGLLDVTKLGDKLLTWNWLAVTVEVTLKQTK